MPADDAPPAPTGPLAGLKVVELANLFAGPLLGAMLGDLGADVVKVEPPEGEPFRQLGGGSSPRPSSWTLTSRNKRMVVLDTKSAAGVQVLAELTAAADVVLLNQPRKLLERLGCTHEAIAERNPGAVVVGISGFGDDGPYADRGGNGTVSEAFAGLTAQQRDEQGRPVLATTLLGDHVGALTGVVGVLAACYWRATAGAGAGQYVELAMGEAALTLLAPQIVAFDPAAAPASGGGGGVRGVYQTASGSWVVVTAYSATQIVRLLEAVGVVLEGEPTGAVLRAHVAEWVAANDTATVVDTLLANRIVSSPVHEVADLLVDPHLAARGHAGHGGGPHRRPGDLPRAGAPPAHHARAGALHRPRAGRRHRRRPRRVAGPRCARHRSAAGRGGASGEPEASPGPSGREREITGEPR